MKNIGYSFNGFTTARLKRFLRTGGQEFTFIERVQNEFGEPAEETLRTVSIFGVLNTSSNAMINSSMSSSSAESSSAGSKSRFEPVTSIITSWESLVVSYSGGKELSPGMFATIGDSTFCIVKTSNLNNWGLIANISLEKFDEWKH